MKQPIRCAHVDDAVDRLLAGAVPPDEDALLREHAATCESCDALLSRLDGLVEGPPAPPEPDDLGRRRGFLAMEARLRETPPRFGWKPMAIAAAAVFAALTVGLVVGQSRGTEPARIASPTEPEGVRWTAPPGGSATFDLGGGTRIVLSEGATARVTGADGPTLELTLATGLLVGELRHEGPVERIFISAPRGRVEVTGTVFAVRATRDDDVVAVREGVVQVISGRRRQEVRAGQAMSLERMTLVAAAPLAPMWRLLGPIDSILASVPSGPAVETPAQTTTSAPTIVARSAPPATTPAPESLASILALRSPDRLAKLISFANDRSHAHADRVSAWRAVVDVDPTRANASFELGMLLSARSPVEADRAFNQYTASSASPPFLQQALQHRMRINERLGHASVARSVAQHYLRSFPDGPDADLARRLAGQ